jgi:hypothetical protein
MILRACIALAVLACFSCGGDDEGTPRDDLDEPGGRRPEPPTTPEQEAADTRLTREVQQRLVGCGLLATDARGARNLVQDDYDRCYARCTLEASCEAIVASSCDEQESALATCIAQCPGAPSDGFACANGKRIAHVAVCDGEEDCRAGEDERDCEVRCADGQPLESADLECDGTPDCSDGSDEAACLTCPLVES